MASTLTLLKILQKLTTESAVICVGQIILSGYGGSGKSRDLQVQAARVTCAICGPRYIRKVWRPVPNPNEDRNPRNTQ